MALHKLTATVFLILTTAILFGQSKKQPHLGFSVGVNYNDYMIKRSNWMQPPIDYNDSLNSISSESSIGFNLGISYYFKLTENILLRPTFILALPSTGKLAFERPLSSETLDVRNISYAFSFPVNLKISTKGFNPYLTIGPGFSFSTQGDDVKEQIKFKTLDLLGQVGFGGEVSFKYFKIKPELLYSTGFSDMRKRKDNIYNNTISSLLQQNLSLTFYLCNLNN